LESANASSISTRPTPIAPTTISVDVENTGGTYTDPRPVRYTLKAFNVDTNETFEVRYDPTRVFGRRHHHRPVQYTLDAAKGILLLRYAMCEASSAVKVTYTGGYAAGDEGDLSATIPVEIKMACLAQVLHMFGKFTADNIGKTADTTEGRTGGNMYASKMGLGARGAVADLQIQAGRRRAVLMPPSPLPPTMTARFYSPAAAYRNAVKRADPRY
jgi:hypothetical protein